MSCSSWVGLQFVIVVLPDHTHLLLDFATPPHEDYVQVDSEQEDGSFVF